MYNNETFIIPHRILRTLCSNNLINILVYH